MQTQNASPFERFAPFIREYIYKSGWQSLREVQVAAASAIFDTDSHLLLSSGTASGKTEAVFFPMLSLLYGDGYADAGVGTGATILYIAPLKSLINDQFARIEALLDEAHIPVTRWHGDVAASRKSAFLREPSGILQITPESLESLLMRRKNDIPRLLGALSFVVLDEVHSLIGSDRGNQVICQLARIERLLGRSVRRIGLSATVGDLSACAAWLSGGTERPCLTPTFPRTALKWRLGFEHFYIQDTREKQSDALHAEAGGAQALASVDAGYEFLYDAVKDHRALVFSNSREETEYVTATLRQIAKKRDERDVFLIHHGNLSASLREEAELSLKEGEGACVTCATVTLELGVDIGRLKRVAQMGAPHSVSAFLQRMGRSGRRGEPPEMLELYREDMPLPNEILPHLIPFDLLRGIAIVQLYGEERFIEPPSRRSQPYSLAFHQTLSILASSGEMTARALAEQVLSLPPLSALSKESYRALLLSMLEQGVIEMTETKGLIVGLAGERLISSFKFYAVFKDSEDFTVRCASDEIGTVTTPPPVGDRFALAGRVWEVEEVDMQARLIFVHGVEGKMEISWPGDAGEVHTRILERMRQVLCEDTEYPYLMENARARLEEARRIARASGMDTQMLVPLGGFSYCLFPWLGTRACRTLKRFLQKYASELGISDIASEGCYYITFKAHERAPKRLFAEICALMEKKGVNAHELVFPSECPAFEKYDPYVPPALLRDAYACDRLSPREVTARFGIQPKDPIVTAKGELL